MSKKNKRDLHKQTPSSSSSSLLPDSIDQFKSKKYWDSFFEQKKDAFEWYGEWDQLKDVITSSLTHCDDDDQNNETTVAPADKKVLVIGCGNSSLSASLYDYGYQNIHNVDFSSIVINEMRQLNKRREKMVWEEMDVTKLTLADSSFDVVLDKGMLDAIASDDVVEEDVQVSNMFSEIARVLNKGGKYVVVTLAQEHVLCRLLTAFSSGWRVEAHRVVVPVVAAGTTGASSASSSSGGGGGSQLAPFAFVLSKLHSSSTTNPAMSSLSNLLINEQHGASIYTPHFTHQSNLTQNQKQITISQLTDLIKEIQWMAAAKSQLSHLRRGKRLSPLDLFDDADQLRYSLSLIDIKTKGKNGNCAVFIVPQGREHEWRFNDAEGQFQLAEYAGFDRFIIVQMHRGQQYENLTAVQQELSPKITELLPKHWDTSKVPFCTEGDSIGHRQTVFQTTSDYSGDIIVEDVEEEGHHLRRLIFLSNRNLIQSEARLQNISDTEKQVCLSYLTFKHHQRMVAGLTLVLPLFSAATAQSLINVAIIGLGGGIFPMFLHEHFHTKVTVIELDKAVADVATNSFLFKKGDRMQLEIADGIAYMNSLATDSQKFDIMIIDVDSKDASIAMSCPPSSFVERTYLEKLKSLIADNGALVINLVCRSKPLFIEVMDLLATIFAQVMFIAIEGDVNKIVYCFSKHLARPTKSEDLLRIGKVLQSKLTKQWHKEMTLKELFDACTVIEYNHSSKATAKNQISNNKATKQKKKNKRNRGKRRR